jgi:hypothetical protein
MAAKAFAPQLIGSLMGDKAESVAGDVLKIATRLTGVADPKKAVEAIQADPQLVMQYKESLMDYQLAVAQEETKRLTVVNQTMQAESKSEHWPQYSWRPFNGFMFAITLFMNYGFPPIANMFIAVFGDTTTEHLVPGSIPEFVFMAWASVLGVATYHRGRAKIEAGGKSAVASGLDAVRNKVASVLGD